MSLKRKVDKVRIYMDILTMLLAATLVWQNESWIVKILSALFIPLLIWDLTISLKKKGKKL